MISKTAPEMTDDVASKSNIKYNTHNSKECCTVAPTPTPAPAPELAPAKMTPKITTEMKTIPNIMTNNNKSNSKPRTPPAISLPPKPTQPTISILVPKDLPQIHPSHNLHNKT